MTRATFKAGKWKFEFSAQTVELARKEALKLLIASKEDEAQITWDNNHTQTIDLNGEWK